MEEVKIVIADDHQLVLDGLKSLIRDVPNYKLIGEANDGKELMEILKDYQADVVLIDVEMPNMNGIEATERIKNKYPNTRILALTMHAEKGIIDKMVEVGANGYILKNVDQEELILAINTIVEGNVYFCDIAQKSKDGASGNELKVFIGTEEVLTEREQEIVKLVAGGLTNKQIADQLFISHRTVDTHRNNIMKKLDVSNVAGLIRYAIQKGYLN